MNSQDIAALEQYLDTPIKDLTLEQIMHFRNLLDLLAIELEKELEELQK